jgi:DNA-binding CsgD family transcriptional regulator
LHFRLRARDTVRVEEGLLGREVELAAVDALLDHAGSGFAALVLEGEPGIGKTTVWREGVRRAEALGFTVLACRPAEAEAKLSFSALTDLLESVPSDTLSELPEPQRRALGVALLRTDAGEVAVEPRAVAAGLRRVLADLAAGASALVAIDDAQWLDSTSARALEFALRRVNDARLGVLAARRSASPPTRERLELADADRLVLGPLSLAAVHGLLKARLGRSLPRPLLLRVYETCGGNPFYALEIAREVLDSGTAPGEALPVPKDLRRLVQRRLRRLSADTRETLLAAAATSESTLHLLHSALERDPTVSLEEAEKAEVVEVVRERVAFSHPLYAAAIYASAPSEQRRRLHRRLSRMVVDPEERARHLALAAEGFEEATAVVLDEAAEHARRRGAPDTAAGLAAQACGLTPPDQRARLLRRTIKAAEYQFHAGELQRAREALEAVVPVAEEERVRAEALRLLGEIRFHESSFVEAMPLFEEALALTDDNALRAMIELQLAFGTNVAGDFATARVHASRALELAEPLGPQGGLAEALAVSAMVEFLCGEGVDERKVERSLGLEDADRQVTAQLRPSLIAGYLRLYEGRLQESVRILGAVRARMLERGGDSDLTWVSSYLAWGECWRGNLSAAATHAAESIDGAEMIGATPLRCFALAFATLAPAYAGERALAQEQIEECRELAPSVGFAIALFWAGWAQALLALSEEDAQTAANALAPFLPRIETEGVPEPILWFFVPEAIEASIGVGEAERAERLLNLFEASARRLGRGWALMAAGRCRSLLLAARGELEGASRWADEAVELGRRLEVRLDFARTLLVAGRIKRRRRQKRAARELLDEALTIFEDAGARLWAKQTRRELDRAVFRPAAFDELTESERRVAELAASGLKNREVAARLFMSPKTVEANLARAYRKLGIHSRAELGAKLAVDRAPAQT